MVPYIGEPETDARLLFEACASRCRNRNEGLRLKSVIDTDPTYFARYTRHARAGHFDLVDDLLKGQAEQTREAARSFYRNQLVPDGSSGRETYNELITSAPYDKCPYCLTAKVSQLDHYLPKNQYPALAVCPQNLVPSCSDCNMAKSNTLQRAGSRIRHPYYENIQQADWIDVHLPNDDPLNPIFSPLTTMMTASSADEWRWQFDTLSLNERFSFDAMSHFQSKRATYRRLAIECGHDELQTQITIDASDIGHAVIFPHLEVYLSKLAQTVSDWCSTLLD